MQGFRGALAGVALVAGLVIPLAGASPASAADGALDTTYGASGVATVAPTRANATAPTSLMTTDASGRTSLAGQPGGVGPTQPVVVRTLADGRSDASFGAGGVAPLTFIPRGLAHQSDGALVLVGSSQQLARFTTSGLSDPAFATVVPGLGASHTVSAVAVASDDSILVAGSQDVGGEPRSWAVRLGKASGALLQSWNLDGATALVGNVRSLAARVDNTPIALTFAGDLVWFAAGATTPQLAGMAQATAFAVDAIDRVVVAGTAGSALAVARFDPSTRSADVTFNGGAPLTFAAGPGTDAASAVVFTSGARPVVLGSRDSGAVLVARSTAAGDADAAFGVGGLLATLVPDVIVPRGGVATAGAVLADGSVMIGGASGILPFVVRVTPAGALDPALGGAGSRWIDSSGPAGSAGLRPTASVAVGRDGSVAGASQDPSGIRIVKLDPSGQRNAAFGTNGEISLHSLNGGLLAIDGLGRVLHAAPIGAQWYVARFTTAGVPDPSFGTNGVVLVPEQGAPSALSVLNGNSVLVVVGGAPAARAAWKLTSGGARDATYGVAGRAALAASVTRAAVQLDGSFVGVESATVARRYDATGNATTSYTLAGATMFDVDVDSAGRVLTVGTSGSVPVVARFLAAGSLDSTFGVGGLRTLVTATGLSRVVVDALDRPYALVNLSSGGRVDRLTTAGTLDASFGTNGSTLLTAALSVSLGDAAFDGSGRLVVAGYSPPTADLRAARFVAAATSTDTTGPDITIVAPADGASYEVGQPRSANYSCTDPTGVASCVGTASLPGPFDVTSIGTKTFTVNARDAAGNVSTKSITYRVVDTTAPFITPTNPVNGQSIPRNAVVPITYQCVDPFLGASGIASCTPAQGTLLDTSTVGARQIDYRAVDVAGNVRTLSITVQILDSTPPTITGTAPSGRYLLDASVKTDYACVDDPGGSGVVSCVGDVPSGGVIDTSTPGPHVLHVVALDAIGNRAERDFSYDVDDRAVASLARGQSLTTGGDPSATDPIETTLVAGRAGTYSVIERPTTVASGWRAVTFGAVITAPDADDKRPHTVTFRIDRSVLDPSLATNVQLLFNGRTVDSCDRPGRLEPDPCITDRTVGSQDATWITVLITRGGTFVPVLRSIAVPITSLNQPTSPAVVRADDRTFTVRYQFSASPGNDALTGVFASDAGDCTENGAGPAHLALPVDFNGRSTSWRLEYKAPSSWRGTCRQIVVSWADGRSDRFLVRF